MRRKHIFLNLFTIAIMFSNCGSNFLDVNNTEQLYRQSYVKDLATMQQFMSGLYILVATTIEDGNTCAYPDLIADNMKPYSLTSSLMLPHYNWTQISDGNDFQTSVGGKAESKAMDALWRSGYKTIRACDFVIEDIGKYRSEDPVKSDDIKGQALAFRAYLHFKLVNTFAQAYAYSVKGTHAGIPYINSSDITITFDRLTVAEVYEKMIEDLTDAIPLLPAIVTDTRIMNKNAAKALLARLYLFKGDFESAIKKAKEVADEFPLMTISAGYPNSVFKLKSPSTTESLFQMTPQSSNYNTNFLGGYLVSSPLFVATNDVASILTENNNDIRKNWIKDTTVGSSVFKLIKKFPAGAAPEVTPAVSPAQIAYYPPIIRSSEMFLTIAEASAKVGDENTARTYLDEIRKRANPTISNITATGNALMDSIYKERRRELAFESLRMYDLQRWKQQVVRVDALQGSPTTLSYPNSKAIAPIPFREVKLAHLAQNADY